MNHFPDNDLISAYVDDRLSSEERAEVEALLQSSAGARAELDSYRQLRATLKALPAASAPPDLLQRVMAQAEQESLHGKPVAAGTDSEEHSAFTRRWTIPAVSVVASVALLVMIMVQLQSPRAPNDSARPLTAESHSLIDSDGLSEVNEDINGTVASNLGVSTLDDESLESGEESFRNGDVEFSKRAIRDGLRKLSERDIRNAEVGDVIESWQVRDDSVVVVELTVIDRQQVLDSVHVLLSNLNVPREAPGASDYGTSTNDVFAVYVQAERGQLQSLLQDLQRNDDVEHMFVSTSISSAELNSYVVEQGYSHLETMPMAAENQLGGRSSVASEPRPGEGESGDASMSAAVADKTTKPLTAPKDRVARRDQQVAEEASEKKSDATSRNFARAAIPPPPPLPRPLELAKSEPELAQAARPLSAAVPAIETEPGVDNQYRRMTLRLPEAVGKKLAAREQLARQLSMSNRDARDRPITRRSLENLRSKQTRKEAEQPKAPAPTPASSRTEQEPETAIAPEQKGQALFHKREADSRPLQVLFVLTPESASAAESAKRPAPASEPPPRN